MYGVLLQAGTVTINFRLLPGETSDHIQQQLLHWLGDDAQHASIAFTDKWETPAAVTDPNGPHFALVKAAIQEAWQLKGHGRESDGINVKKAAGQQHSAADEGAGSITSVGRQQQQQGTGSIAGDIAPELRSAGLHVVPYLLCGGTDSKWYANLTSNILRFAPFSVNRRAGDLKRVHGTDERLSVQDFGRMLCTFRAGMRTAGMHMHLGSKASKAAGSEQEVTGPDSSTLHARQVVEAGAGSIASTVDTGSNNIADEL
jgi:acetylornithine deacetylase/succinyl-diaminopimelate desuccinylase-like protein